MGELISIDEARRLVLEAIEPLAAEHVPLAEALGRVLAEELVSPIDVPPFDSSAMDGYAVVAGPAAELRLIGEARAGHPAGERVEPGTAVRISTGAALPQGATAVVPEERAQPPEDGVVRVEAAGEGDNVRYAGEDLRAGQPVLASGSRLGAAELGVAASAGRDSLSCARRPRVALLITGDELAEPGQPLAPGAIYGSNGVTLAAQVELSGGAAVAPTEIVRDSAEETRAAIDRALATADVVVVSGGVSIGPHDHVKAAFAELGVGQRFWGVRLRPGKPTWFGSRGGVLAFGLPGNPVSALVTFQLFVRPALAALQGADPHAGRGSAVLDEAVARHPRREQAVRVRLRGGDDGWRATPTGPQGSHMLSSMLGADALALVAPGDGELPAGARVEVELL